MLDNLRNLMSNYTVPMMGTEIVETEHLPRFEVGRLRHGIQIHPHLAIVFRWLGLSTFWAWGPWIRFTKESDPVAVEDFRTHHRRIFMSPRQVRALREELSRTPPPGPPTPERKKKMTDAEKLELYRSALIAIVVRAGGHLTLPPLSDIPEMQKPGSLTNMLLEDGSLQFQYVVDGEAVPEVRVQ